MAESDQDVQERLAWLDEALDRLEGTPGPTAELALAAVEALAGVYGEALARTARIAAADPTVLRGMADDPLVGHLLVLHDAHPDPVEQRVARALDEVRPYLASHGGTVELAGIVDGVARVRLAGSCQGCASSAATLESAVTDAVLGVAPELSTVESVGADTAGRPALIPAESLLRRPVASGTADRVRGPG